MEYGNYHETKSHVDVNFPYNTYLCSIPQDFFSVPVHWHDEAELVVIKKGKGIVAVDLEARPVKAGEIVVIASGQLHSIEQQGQESMEYENILFRPDFLMTASEDICSIEFLIPFFEGRIRFPSWITVGHEWYGELTGCIDSIDRVCSVRPIAYQLAVKGLLYQFFFYLYSGEKEILAQGRSLKSLDRMKIILDKMERGYGEKITIETMAEAVGFSQSHFMRYFKQNMGVSFVDYLNDYRLSMASRLLASSSLDVIGVAMETGFVNVSYFNRLFKKKFGVTPGRYREASDLRRTENREEI